MKMRKVIKSSLICLLALGTISSLNNGTINAKRHHHTRYSRTVRRYKYKRNHNRKRRSNHRARRHTKYHKLNRRHGKYIYTFTKRHHHTNHRNHHKIYKSHKHLLGAVAPSTHHSKTNRNEMYLLDTEGDSGQLMDDQSFQNLRDGSGDSVCADSADDGELVHLDGKAVVDGKVFYKISDSNDPIDTGWVYSGDLSYNPNANAHPIDISSLPYPSTPDNTSNTTSTSKPALLSASEPVQQSQSNIDATLAEMQPQIINNINTARQNQGLAPLIESPKLDQIANMRAKQAQKVYGHYDPETGNIYADEDGYNLGYNSTPNGSYYSENLDEVNLGNMPSQDRQHMYHSSNGIELAHNTVNDMLYHDSPNNWTHRYNILDPNPKYIGVGVNYQKGQDWPFKIAEDFK